MAANHEQIFAGEAYKNTRATLDLLKKDFPEKYAQLMSDPARLEDWKRQIDGGERDDDQTRDDIVEHVIGEADLMAKYGITAEEAQKVMLGGNEGGTNLSALKAAPTPEGQPELKKGAPPEETKTKEGVGGPELKILTSKEMKWHFDKGTGKWYVEYGLPNSNRTMIFEADPDQMDQLFGEGMRPQDFEESSLRSITQRQGATFAGNIGQMAGTGSFEAEVERVTALALDDGVLPEWAKQDGQAMDIIYTAQAENKSTEWVLNQLSKTPAFKERFPELEAFKEGSNLTLAEAIGGFLEMEAGVNQALKATGQEGSATPGQVGQLLAAGHSLKTVQDTVQGFARMSSFAPALDAFNQILLQQGEQPITEIQDMLDFVSGKSSSAIYDLYESSSIQEAAVAAGLGSVFSAQDAIQLATSTNQTLQSATQGMQKAAELLLRMRHEVDVGKFGLDHEELLDISLGQTPRSGRTQSEILENVNRAVLSAQGSLNRKASPQKSLGQAGGLQAGGLRGLRQES